MEGSEAHRQWDIISWVGEGRMGNKLYLPKFRSECDHELLSSDVGVGYACDEPFTNTEYVHIWVQPKNVRIGLDQVR